MNIREHFESIALHLQACAKAGEVLLVWFAAEQSHFVRFNKSKVRQAMMIEQATLSVTLINGKKKVQKSITLTLHASDIESLSTAIAELRALVPLVPEDPHLLYSTTVQSTESNVRGKFELPDASTVINLVTKHAAGVDFVGLFASGPNMRGFANSIGQRNWHSVDSFSLEWCLYSGAPGRGDKAIKCSYSGNHFDEAVFVAKLTNASSQLKRLADTPKVLQPGPYRSLLSAAAVNELIGLLSWGGFGEKAWRTKQSPLDKLYSGEQQFSNLFTLTEDTGNGLATPFGAAGFVKPPSAPLIAKGKGVGRLISARSAQEYSIKGNGADESETPASLLLGGGSLKAANELKALDRGLIVSNLWYTNYSDRQNCRVTGMTRFSCFWVEDGEIIAPLNVMRFDDSMFNVFGANLIALGETPELMPDTSSYKQRALGSTLAPCALVEDFKLTL
jgi:predicted Zn-dependent protease